MKTSERFDIFLLGVFSKAFNVRFKFSVGSYPCPRLILKGCRACSFLGVSFQGLIYGLLGVADLSLGGLAVAALSAVSGDLLAAGSLRGFLSLVLTCSLRLLEGRNVVIGFAEFSPHTNLTVTERSGAITKTQP